MFSEESQKNNQRKITTMLMSVGIPVKSKGFEFIRRAITIAVNRPETLSSLTKKLYPEVAKSAGTTTSCVERNIRYALCNAWNSGGAARFRNATHINFYDAEKMTSGEFIAIATETILLGNI